MAESEDKVAEFIELGAAQDRLPTACEHIERNFERGNIVSIHAADREQAGRLDKLLWTFKQSSFVPHVLLDEVEEPVIEPVIIAADDEDPPEADVLFVLSGETPERWIDAYDHVYDFAPVYDDELKKAARQRFKTYQDAGYQMRFIGG